MSSYTRNLKRLLGLSSLACMALPLHADFCEGKHPSSIEFTSQTGYSDVIGFQEFYHPATNQGKIYRMAEVVGNGKHTMRYRHSSVRINGVVGHPSMSGEVTFDISGSQYLEVDTGDGLQGSILASATGSGVKNVYTTRSGGDCQVLQNRGSFIVEELWNESLGGLLQNSSAQIAFRNEEGDGFGGTSAISATESQSGPPSLAIERFFQSGNGIVYVLNCDGWNAQEGKASIILSEEDTPEIALANAKTRVPDLNTGGPEHWNSAYTEEIHSTPFVTNKTQHRYGVSGRSSQYTAKWEDLCPGKYLLLITYRYEPLPTNLLGVNYESKTAKIVEVKSSAEPQFTHSEMLPTVDGYKTILGSTEVNQVDGRSSLSSMQMIALTGGCASNCAAPGALAKLCSGSVNWSLDLGETTYGQDAGVLFLFSEDIDANIYTPDGLVFEPQHPNVDVVKTSDTLRQIHTGEKLIDIVTLQSPATGYEVSVYLKDQIGAKDTTTMLYAILAGEIPQEAYRFEDPSNSLPTLRVTTLKEGSSITVVDIIQDTPNNTWTVEKGNGIDVLTRQSRSLQPDGSDQLQVTTTEDGQANIATKTQERIRSFSVAGYDYERTIEKIENPDSVNGDPLITTYSYYEDAVMAGLLKTTIDPSGGWTTLTYDSSKRITKEVSQFQNSLVDSADALNRVTTYDYTSLPDSDGDSEDEAMVTVIRKLLGQEVSRSFEIKWSNRATQNGHLTYDISNIQAHISGAAWNAPENAVTKTRYHAQGLFADEVMWMVYPDQTAQIYFYGYNSDGDRVVTTAVGVPDTLTEPSAIIDGMRTITITKIGGEFVSSSSEDIVSGIQVASSTVTEYDDYGRATRIEYLDGTYITRSYACCGLDEETDTAGNVTKYTYDSLGRIATQTTAYNTPEALVTQYEYDAAGRITQVILNPGVNEIVQSQSEYNPAGDLVWTQDALNRQTSYTRSIVNDLIVFTTTYPDGSTQVQTQYQDGSSYEVTGTATYGMRYDESVEQDGAHWVRVNTNTQLNNVGNVTNTFTKIFTDALGRNYKTETPSGTGSGVATTLLEYNSKHQLSKQTSSDSVVTLFGYNAKGEQDTVAIDIDGSGSIELNGTDRVTRTLRTYVTDRGHDLVRVATEIFETNNTYTATVVQISDQSLNSLDSWVNRYGVETHTAVSIDVDNKKYTSTMTYPDGTQSQTITQYGRLLSETTLNNQSNQLTAVTYAYDDFGRIEFATDLRNGDTVYSYYDDGQVATITTPDPDLSMTGNGYDAQVTSFQYFLDPTEGRKTITILPDSTTTTQEYYPTGEIKKQYGASTYPTEYTYDYAGRLKTMTTWQQFDASTGQGTSGSALTTWNYNDAGLLITKMDNENQGPTYAYTTGGLLKTRTWQRGVVTTYDYAPGSNDLLTTIYSSDPQSTPGVTYTYTRDGRIQTITDASGARTIGYEAGQPLDETYTSGLFAGHILDRSLDALNRSSGYTLSDPASTVLNTASYQYDATTGRFKTISSNGHTHTYSYVANSSLVASMVTDDGNTNILTQGKSWDNLNRLNLITATDSQTTTLSSYSYQYNNLNQRTHAYELNGGYWQYGYDALGQVNAATKYDSNDSALPGYSYGFAFDDIGNRTSSTIQGRQAIYTPNLLNQYEEREVPRYVHTRGTADTLANVTVNGQATTRTGELFFHEYDLTAESDPNLPKWLELEIEGTLAGAGDGGADAVASEERAHWLASNPETFQHDVDGNLLSDGLWTYIWNAENRLIEMQTRASAVAVGASDLKLVFAYDSQGRRFSKKVFRDSVLETTEYFLYDGWNLIAKLDGNKEVIQSYIWGLDLSGTLQGAGGVGGLLTVTDAIGSTYLPSYDGNGNVMGYFAADTGENVAEFEYGPFGELIRATGPMADEMNFRFSTKYQDAETGLLYYGYRYYNADTGRWLNRDPIEERGGKNLYRFVFNSALNYADYLGRDPFGYNETDFWNDLLNDAFPGGPPEVGVEVALREVMSLIIGVLPRYPTPGFTYGQNFPVGTVGAVSISAGWKFSGKIHCCKKADGQKGLMATGTFGISFGGGLGASASQQGKLPKPKNPELKPGSLSTSKELPACVTTIKDFTISVKISGKAAAGIGGKLNLPIGEYSAANGLRLTIGKGPNTELILGAGASIDLVGTGSQSGSVELN